MQYEVAFFFEDNDYEVEFTDDGPVLKNLTAGDLQGPFEDAVKLLEESIIKGNKMINIIDELEYVVLH